MSVRQADVYVSELLSYSLERLRKEPELLAAESQRMERNLQVGIGILSFQRQRGPQTEVLGSSC